MKTIRTFIYIAASLFILNSCKTAKEYERPGIVLQSTFDSTTSFADTSSIAEIPWRTFFADTTLRGLISRGLEYNHDLLIALKRIDIAGQQLKQARVLNLPSVNLQVSSSINRPSDNSLNGLSTQSFLQKSHVENYSALAAISWEADIWGKIRGRKEIALISYLQTTEAVKAVQTGLVASIAQGFYNLLMLDKQLEITRRNLQLNDSFLLATRLLKDAGNITLLAVEQAESQQQTTALLIPALEQDIVLQENALQLITGQVPGRVARKVTLTQLTLPAELPAGLPIGMVARRPDVRSE